MTLQTLFNCNSKNVIYILMCTTCDWFYLGQKANLGRELENINQIFFSSQNNFCKQWSEHLRDCSIMKECFFRIYLFLYENKKELRDFKEKHFIMIPINKLLKYS